MNKNVPFNKPSTKIGGDIASHQGILPHNAKSPMTSASPRANTGDERMAKMVEPKNTTAARAAVAQQTSQTSDWSDPGH